MRFIKLGEVSIDSLGLVPAPEVFTSPSSMMFRSTKDDTLVHVIRDGRVYMDREEDGNPITYYGDCSKEELDRFEEMEECSYAD